MNSIVLNKAVVKPAVTESTPTEGGNFIRTRLTTVTHVRLETELSRLRQIVKRLHQSGSASADYVQSYERSISNTEDELKGISSVPHNHNILP